MTPTQAACLADALATGYVVLEQGGPGVVAVEGTIGLLEASGLFNAGRGSRRQLDGVMRMDSSGLVLEPVGSGTLKVSTISTRRRNRLRRRPCRSLFWKSGE